LNILENGRLAQRQMADGAATEAARFVFRGSDKLQFAVSLEQAATVSGNGRLIVPSN
jgi:hypothetical protein